MGAYIAVVECSKLGLLMHKLMGLRRGSCFNEKIFSTQSTKILKEREVD